MSIKNYFPILKTTVSEIRALRHIDFSKHPNVCPVFELTKSRKTKKDEVGSVYKRISEIKEIIGQDSFILDLTLENSLSNKQIESFFDDSDYFSNWRSFILSLKKDNLHVLPVIQSYDDTTDRELVNQMSYFSRICGRFVIRLKPEFLDMEVSKNLINSAQGFDFITIFDMEYIDKDNMDFSIKTFSQFISECLKEDLNLGKIVIACSSFPPQVNHNNNLKGSFRVFEQEVFSNFLLKFGDHSVNYGDYASIYPFRKDITAYNWVPRIDYPISKSIIYYRERRDDGGYKECAKRLVKDQRFHSNPINCWGWDEINTACIKPNGKSPSYWISVRINIHINRVILWQKTINQ